MFCDGGLFMCSVCGCFEGATTDHCPGDNITWYAMDEVYAGRLNFRDGAWRHEPCEIWNVPGRPGFNAELYAIQKPRIERRCMLNRLERDLKEMRYAERELALQG
jgi:hypothetical protein